MKLFPLGGYYHHDRDTFPRRVEECLRWLVCAFKGHEPYTHWSYKCGYCYRCGEKVGKSLADLEKSADQSGK